MEQHGWLLQIALENQKKKKKADFQHNIQYVHQYAFFKNSCKQKDTH